MATLTPTLILSSTDATSDVLNFSVTDSLNITGDVVSLNRIALSTSDLTLLTTSYGKSYVYFKNTDSSIVITIQFGGDSTKNSLVTRRSSYVRRCQGLDDKDNSCRKEFAYANLQVLYPG